MDHQSKEIVNDAAGRQFLWHYLFVLLSMGVVYLSVTPIFEGFDETAHYSSFRESANLDAIPIYGQSYILKDINQYQGPTRYRSFSPPYDHSNSYRNFFERPEAKDRFVERYRQTPIRISNELSNELNWQAQHPFLYYSVLGPITRLSDSLSLTSQFLLLRLISYCFALGGVLFAFLAFGNPSVLLHKDPAVYGFLLYPVILPMFFPEFARLGNDSLCLLFSGLTAYSLKLILQNLDRRRSIIKPSLALGCALGAGLMTKALFVPITVSVFGFLFLQLWREYRHECQDGSVSRILSGIGVVGLVVLVIAGGWYLYKLIVYGDATGSHDVILLNQKGGLVANLFANFSLYPLATGLAGLVVTWSWGGTWSLARLSPWLHLPLLALLGWTLLIFL